MTIFPSRLFVRLAAAVALLAVLAVPIPMLVAPTLAMLAILIALAGADLLAARRDVAPSVQRLIADRVVKGRSATIIYKV